MRVCVCMHIYIYIYIYMCAHADMHIDNPPCPSKRRASDTCCETINQPQACPNTVRTPGLHYKLPVFSDPAPGKS